MGGWEIFLSRSFAQLALLLLVLEVERRKRVDGGRGMRRADRQPGYSLVPSIQLSMLCSCSVLCLLLCCSLLLQYLYYQVLLLISTGTVLVYMYWYCRSIAQVHACERPTGYIKYESLVRMTLNPTHESIPLDSMCAT